MRYAIKTATTSATTINTPPVTREVTARTNTTKYRDKHRGLKRDKVRRGHVSSACITNNFNHPPFTPSLIRFALIYFSKSTYRTQPNNQRSWYGEKLRDYAGLHTTSE